MTGEEFKKRVELAWDKAYSAYYDNTKFNRLISYSLYNMVEKMYRNLSTQKQYDELSNFIKTGISATLRSNILHTSSLPITNVSVVGTTVTVTTARPHYFTASDVVDVANVAATSIAGINGSFTVTNVTTNTFTYTDATAAITGYTAGSGDVTIGGFMLTDYFHYLAIKVYSRASSAAAITNISANATGGYTDVTAPNHNLRAGDTFVISDVASPVGANNTWEAGDYTIRNKNVVRINSVLVGTYSGGGNLYLTHDEWAIPYTSDTKISTLNTPSVYEPRVETQLGTLRFYPSNTSSVAIDYMSTAPYTIDVTRTADNLLLYYSQKFLDRLLEEVVYNAAEETRDEQRMESALQDLQINP